MPLPYRITTTDRRKYRTSHGLTSCRRAFVVDGYDSAGNQHIIRTDAIAKHSAGKLSKPVPEPIQMEPCGYCGHVGEPVQFVDEWPSCANCGGV